MCLGFLGGREWKQASLEGRKGGREGRKETSVDLDEIEDRELSDRFLYARC